MPREMGTQVSRGQCRCCQIRDWRGAGGAYPSQRRYQSRDCRRGRRRARNSDKSHSNARHQAHARMSVGTPPPRPPHHPRRNHHPSQRQGCRQTAQSTHSWWARSQPCLQGYSPNAEAAEAVEAVRRCDPCVIRVFAVLRSA